MTDPRAFDLADVLAVTTSRRLRDNQLDAVYDLIRHTTGSDPQTGDPIRQHAQARAEIYRQHPWLADIQTPDTDDPDTLTAWLQQMEDEHGQRLDITPANATIAV